MMDPVQEALSKIPDLRRRAQEIRVNDPPSHTTDVIPEAVITERMRRDAKARASADRRMLGADY